MCTMYLGTRLLYRDPAMMNTLGAATLILLIFDPRFVAGRIKRFVGEVWSVRLVLAIARFAFGISELLFISAIMQIKLALPMAYYFHRATTIGLPANVVVVPLTELMIPAAITA